jgi:hypothetical protein
MPFSVRVSGVSYSSNSTPRPLISSTSGGDWTASAISRWETGDRRIRPVDLRALLDIYDVQGSEREVLLTLAREARQRGWWQSYRSDAVPEWFQVYLGLEAEASSIHEYAAELVPGLLQTQDYYRAFMNAAPAAGDGQAIERKLAVRSARQERLTAESARRMEAQHGHLADRPLRSHLAQEHPQQQRRRLR